VQQAMDDLYALGLVDETLPDSSTLTDQVQIDALAALQGTFNKPLTQEVWTALQKEFEPPEAVVAPEEESETPAPASTAE
jgi:hypothetical protein